MDSIFDNAHVIVVDKPGGWLSVPSRMGARDERRCAGRELERSLGVRLWPVHRLDEEVTGLLVFAKSAEAHAAANGWFEHHSVRKTYEAWTERPKDGLEPAPGEHVWQCILRRGKKRAYEAPHGKPALTKARLVDDVEHAGHSALAWELEPVTGRPHQLRYELMRHGCPVLGDALYGSTRPFLAGTIALRCVRLDLSACLDAERFGLPSELTAPTLRAWLASTTATP